MLRSALSGTVASTPLIGYIPDGSRVPIARCSALHPPRKARFPYPSGTPLRQTAVVRERYKAVSKSFYQGAHAIILIFSVIDKNTFGNIRNWISQLKKEVNEKVPLILVGNKIDCEEKRVINKLDAEKLANEFNINYYDCSAKTGQNINKAFDDLIKRLVKTVDRTKDKQVKIGIKKQKKKKCC